MEGLPSNCLICQRTAHGFHCGVFTCKGCKTFFRRAYLSENRTECSLNKDCYDLTKRNQPIFRCRPCRFKKCILVGMNPKDLVAGDRNKEEYGALLTKNVETVDNLMEKSLTFLTHLEQEVENFRMSAYNPNWVDIEKVEILLNSPNKLSFAKRYGQFPGWPLRDVTYKLQHNYFQYFSPSRKHWWFFNLLTVIEYVKTFSFFHKINSKDQLILIKYVSVGCLNFHICFFTFRNGFQYLTQPDGSQHPHRTEPDYQTVALLLSSLHRTQVRHEEYLLLKALYICNPAVPGLSRIAQKFLEEERSIHSRTLFNFCIQTRNDTPSRFVELIGILGLIEKQQKKLRDIYLFSFGPMLAKLPSEFTIDLIEDVFSE